MTCTTLSYRETIEQPEVNGRWALTWDSVWCLARSIHFVHVCQRLPIVTVVSLERVGFCFPQMLFELVSL